MSAIKINKSSEKVIREFSTYKGVAKVKVLAVNPTLAELQALGMNFNSEPEYTDTTDSGDPKVRIDFIIGNDKVTTKLTFFLEKRDRVSNSGDKWEFINNFGQTSWGASVDEVTSRTGKNGNTWFKEEGARNAYVGEADLIKFLSDWLNVNPEDQVYLEKIENLFTGNVSELKMYVEAAAENELFVLLTVRENDGKYYQNVYNRFFTRASFTPQAAITRFIKEAKKQEDSGYPIKGFEGVEFREFVPSLDISTPDIDTPTTQQRVESAENLF